MGFARVEVQEEHLLSEHVVTMAMNDVDNCSNRLRFGEGNRLSEFFGYPSVLARELGVTTLNGQPIGPDTVLYPLAASQTPALCARRPAFGASGR